MKKPWRIAGWLALVLVAALGYSGYRIVWGKPFTINMLANRQTLEFLFQNPEAFTQVGIADGTVFDTYSGKLAPYGVTKRDHDYAQAAAFLLAAARGAVPRRRAWCCQRRFSSPPKPM